MSLSTKCRTKATYPLIGKTIELLKVELEIMTEPKKKLQGSLVTDGAKGTCTL